ncbi:hypothetical protein SKAU_G00093040 [Synaphobranchus kaupii]|uniref:Uncharacterized protein n=1 Tax=Synaphobranchus kaupii TaxID=118154 RepID=A0A9Q1FXZ6_SYNKA|nr:hypothetical protein SKAU_G00093040 [Synaphobranchus kaupii]
MAGNEGGVDEEGDEMETRDSGGRGSLMGKGKRRKRKKNEESGSGSGMIRVSPQAQQLYLVPVPLLSRPFVLVKVVAMGVPGDDGRSVLPVGVALACLTF